MPAARGIRARANEQYTRACIVDSGGSSGPRQGKDSNRGPTPLRKVSARSDIARAVVPGMTLRSRILILSHHRLAAFPNAASPPTTLARETPVYAEQMCSPAKKVSEEALLEDT